MKRMLTVLVVVLFPLLAAAQDNSLSRFELRGTGGWIGFADDSMIHHGLVGASMRVSLVGGLGVEPELLYMIGPGTDRDVALTPVVSWEFGKGRVRPYVLGAPGVLWHQQRSDWQSEYHISAGFGVRTQINPRWSVSPEFRMGWWPHFQFKAAVGYRF